MLLYGKLTLTPSGLMLDEVRSLLQKALRRKEKSLVLQATKELLGRGKDYLPWKSLITFLFEDHCLASTKILQRFNQCYGSGNKYGAVQLLLSCKTSRIAACLPVIALQKEYDPIDWTCEVDKSFTGLVALKKGKINGELVLTNLKSAWTCKDHKRLITFMKLATMVCDYDKPTISKKGESFMLGSKVKKPHFGLLVLSMLYKNTKESDMKQYIAQCNWLASIPDVPVRLILFAPVVRLMFGDKVCREEQPKVKPVDWEAVGMLSEMPSWAVDKHTYRGKYGKASLPLLEKKRVVPKMSEKLLQIFHGPRPQRDIQHFFSLGAKVTNEAVENPFWSRTQQIYLSKTKKLQKTMYMTKVYYEEKSEEFPYILYDPNRKDNTDLQKAKSGKRSKDDVGEEDTHLGIPEKKMRKTISRQNEINISSKGLVTKQQELTREKEIKGTFASADVSGPKTETEGTYVAMEQVFPDSTQPFPVLTGDLSAPHLMNETTQNMLPISSAGHDVPQIDDVAATSYGVDESFENFLSGLQPVTPSASASEKTESRATGPAVPPNTTEITDLSFLANFSSKNCDEPTVGEEETDTGVLCTESWDEEVKGMPLLQIPTGAAKVYTRLDVINREVIKGPYIDRKWRLTMFYHKVFRNLLHDPHTLEITPCKPYLKFKLMCARDAKITVNSKVYKDVISKNPNAEGKFVSRESLGVIQLHRLESQKYKLLPYTIWLHFIYRFAMNIGDSGLYNALTDAKLSFVVGIDMEESRHNVKGTHILDLLFVMRPSKDRQAAVTNAIRQNKKALLEALEVALPVAKITAEARKYNSEFQMDLFLKRINSVKNCLSKLK